MCIYFKNRDDLTYTSGEHIFPAGIGGIEKLPNHYVSKEANNFFSGMEGKLMHNSLVSIPRALLGPSKRKGKREGKKIVQLFRNKEVDGYTLGYLREGIPYTIPQLIWNKNNPEVKLVMEPQEVKDIEEDVLKFINSLLVCKKEENVVFHLESIVPKGVVFMGVADKYLHIMKSDDENIDDKEMEDVILKFRKEYFKQEKEVIAEKSQVEVQSHLIENEDMARIYGKIAFNVLAKLKGESYVLRDEFDDFRNWIIKLKEYDENINFFPTYNKNSIKELLPENSHFCIISEVENKIVAYVSLYGIDRSLVMGDIFDESFKMPIGMICDWKNQREYGLLEYIAQLN